MNINLTLFISYSQPIYGTIIIVIACLQKVIHALCDHVTCMGPIR